MSGNTFVGVIGSTVGVGVGCDWCWSCDWKNAAEDGKPVGVGV